MKNCRKCGETRPRSEFHKHKASRDGLARWCKSCIAVYFKAQREKNRAKLAGQAKAYYQTNHDRIKAYKKEYHEKNRATLAAKNKIYRETHGDQLAEKVKKWQAGNRDKVIGYKKKYEEAHRADKAAYNRTYRREFPEKNAAQQRSYSQANREKRRAWYNNYRARAQNAEGCATSEQIQARWDYYGNACYICGAPAEATDHVKPIAQGGANWPCNQRPICNRCNSLKGSKWPYDFEAHRSSEVNIGLRRTQ